MAYAHRRSENEFAAVPTAFQRSGMGQLEALQHARYVDLGRDASPLTDNNAVETGAQRAQLEVSPQAEAPQE